MNYASELEGWRVFANGSAPGIEERTAKLAEFRKANIARLDRDIDLPSERCTSNAVRIAADLSDFEAVATTVLPIADRLCGIDQTATVVRVDKERVPQTRSHEKWPLPLGIDTRTTLAVGSSRTIH